MKNEINYIIPSIGRSWSTLMTSLIVNASGKKDDFFIDLPNKQWNNVIKTHSPLFKEPEFQYKAIYMYWDIESTIASTYRVNLLKHLTNLHVKTYHKIIFYVLYIINKNIWFLYLIKWDKFRFKENIDSRKKSKNTLFVKYEDLINNKDKKIEEISEFLWLKLPNFKIKKRKTSFSNLPNYMLNEIKKEYWNFKI